MAKYLTANLGGMISKAFLKRASDIVRGITFSVDFQLDKTKSELEHLLGNLDEATVSVMEKYARKAQEVIVAQFNRTAVYRRPARRTGRLLAALNTHSIIKSGSQIIARVGDRKALPTYWEYQELGSRPYTFEEKYHLIYRDGKPKLYTVRPARPGSLNNILDNPGSVGTTHRYFARRPHIIPVTLTISHPGVRKREFIKAGRTFLFRALPYIFQEIIGRAMPKGVKQVRRARTNINLGEVEF